MPNARAHTATVVDAATACAQGERVSATTATPPSVHRGDIAPAPAPGIASPAPGIANPAPGIAPPGIISVDVAGYEDSHG